VEKDFVSGLTYVGVSRVKFGLDLGLSLGLDLRLFFTWSYDLGLRSIRKSVSAFGLYYKVDSGG
jgi:hypothetical protein